MLMSHYIEFFNTPEEIAELESVIEAHRGRGVTVEMNNYDGSALHVLSAFARDHPVGHLNLSPRLAYAIAEGGEVALIWRDVSYSRSPDARSGVRSRYQRSARETPVC